MEEEPQVNTNRRTRPTVTCASARVLSQTFGHYIIGFTTVSVFVSPACLCGNGTLAYFVYGFAGSGRAARTSGQTDACQLESVAFGSSPNTPI